MRGETPNDGDCSVYTVDRCLIWCHMVVLEAIFRTATKRAGEKDVIDLLIFTK